ncbi:MAG TPA: hypothetical protein VJN70_14720 [Gemmatimonadaceae bacterium]|nr:hypothetical protein [Gemmatimonadaceae bacterium]
MPKRPLIDAATLRRLSVTASCDPRTIRKMLRGEKVLGLAGERARAALIKEGLIRNGGNDD